MHYSTVSQLSYMMCSIMIGADFFPFLASHLKKVIRFFILGHAAKCCNFIGKWTSGSLTHTFRTGVVISFAKREGTVYSLLMVEIDPLVWL